LACTTHNAVAHTGLGKVYQEHGRTREAIEQYERALKINPVHLQAHNNLGAIFFHQWEHDQDNRKLIEKAIGHYQAAVRAAPNYAKAHNNLGACYWSDNRLQEAVAEFRTALKIEPDYADAKKNLAAVLPLQRQQEKLPPR
jgi:tetratricopeptide (TPR) repeat protein